MEELLYKESNDLIKRLVRSQNGEYFYYATITVSTSPYAGKEHCMYRGDLVSMIFKLRSIADNDAFAKECLIILEGLYKIQKCMGAVQCG